jgi:hypothetical protein
MDKVIRVKAQFVTWEEGLIFKEQKSSDCQVDSERLQRDVQLALEELNREGYEVVAITPITSGNYSSSSNDYGGYGYGFSYTDAILITACCKQQFAAREIQQ